MPRETTPGHACPAASSKAVPSECAYAAAAGPSAQQAQVDQSCPALCLCLWKTVIALISTSNVWIDASRSARSRPKWATRWPDKSKSLMPAG